ncbi:acyltransferase family protein [Streptomyces sp. NPDC058701]|uniref:acyltransferase family protein n=1 Tax=Streptomyces sp. NPDC058701 TaxID=3346608 RepID=UPI003669E83B
MPRSLPSLTGARWAAALLVFLYHVHIYGYFGGPAAEVVGRVFAAGRTGVSFFFVLSGFVLVWSAPAHDSARSFWRRRAARVYPVHLVTGLCGMVLSARVLPWLRPHGLLAAVGDLILVSSWFPAWDPMRTVSWSLACEAFFYLVFPALVTVLRRCTTRVLIVVAALCAGAVLLLPAAALLSGLRWTPFFPPVRFPEFALGAVLACLVRRNEWRGPRTLHAGAVTAIGYSMAHFVPAPFADAACTVGGFALLIPALAVADLRGLRSVWRSPPAVRLGKLSFAFYMVHVLIMGVGERLAGAVPRFAPGTGTAFTGVVFCAALACAWLMYETVEEPGRGLLLGRRKEALS